MPGIEVQLHVEESGHGDPVVLLHGFPEFSYCWRHQLPALAAAGFHAIAPDLRGYNLSGRPRGVRNYRTNDVVADVAALIRELPAAYRRTLRHNPRQWLRSWYVLFFQLPWLPELLIRSRDFALLERAWRKDPVTPGAYSAEDIARYKEVLRQPGALTAAINYYRAAMWWPGDLCGEPQAVAAPTLLIWGEQDRYLGLDLTEGLEAWIPDLRVERIAGASHWVQNDVPDEVNRLLVDFLGG